MTGWWSKIGSQDYPWYRRDISVGTLSFRLDVWPADSDQSEWFYSFQGFNAGQFSRRNSASLAMASCEANLDVNLKALRKLLK